MKEKIEQLQKEIEIKVKEVKTLKEWNDLKVEYLGKKGPISAILSGMRDLSIEEKKETGKLVNELKETVGILLDEQRAQIEAKELEEKLSKEEIDISLPATKIPVGTPNILEKLIEESEELFMSMGYDVVEGPEL